MQQRFKILTIEIQYQYACKFFAAMVSVWVCILRFTDTSLITMQYLIVVIY